MADNVTSIEEGRKKRGRPSKKTAAQPAPDKPRRPGRWVEPLPVRLTEAEREQRVIRLLAVFEEIKAIEAERKARVAELRGRLAEKKKEEAELARIVGRGEEAREVEVVEQLAPGSNTVEIIRTDTGACIGTRPLLAEERQAELWQGTGSWRASGKVDETVPTQGARPAPSSHDATDSGASLDPEEVLGAETARFDQEEG